MTSIIFAFLVTSFSDYLSILSFFFLHFGTCFIFLFLILGTFWALCSKKNKIHRIFYFLVISFSDSRSILSFFFLLAKFSRLVTFLYCLFILTLSRRLFPLGLFHGDSFTFSGNSIWNIFSPKQHYQTMKTYQIRFYYLMTVESEKIWYQNWCHTQFLYITSAPSIETSCVKFN